jgi:hypothetical protein
MRGHL